MGENGNNTSTLELTPENMFLVTAQDRSARCGILECSHGSIPTPVFMPVGTNATVKGILPNMLTDLGVGIVLANAFHLMLSPGVEIIEKHGGLHPFMNWHKPILTDSGGYQIFSLKKLCEINAEGVHFRSPIDGARIHLNAEKSMDIQTRLGADIVMCFDECLHYPATYAATLASMRLSLGWAKRCRNAFHTTGGQKLFGIIQGGMDVRLRGESAREISAMQFDGIAIGGLSVGEPAQLRAKALDASLLHIPDTYPRYLMGIGKPEDIIEAVSMGVDMFDCVIPTRHARTGFVYTRNGILKTRNACFRNDFSPLETGCSCYTCSHFTRAYLFHLDKRNEMLGCILKTIHNLAFFHTLMQDIATAIKSKSLQQFKKHFLTNYTQGRGMA